MTVLALILLAIAIFLVVVAFSGRGDQVDIDVFDFNIDTTVTEVFIAGVVTGIIALASLVLLRVSLRRSWQRRREVRDLRRQAQQRRTVEAHEADATRDVDVEPDTTLSDVPERPREPRRG
jgi:uncharacterized membrane protein YciS (DUF1049 family)